MFSVETILVTQELFALLSEVDEFKGAWRALSTIAPERLNALLHVATVESIESSTRIEGSKLTDREVERLLGSLRRFGTRDQQGIAGYADVMETAFRSWADMYRSRGVLGSLCFPNHTASCVHMKLKELLLTPPAQAS
jgi:hypothetical protein